MTNTHVDANSVKHCLTGGSLPPAMPVVLCVVCILCLTGGSLPPAMHTVSDRGQSSPSDACCVWHGAVYAFCVVCTVHTVLSWLVHLGSVHDLCPVLASPTGGWDCFSLTCAFLTGLTVECEWWPALWTMIGNGPGGDNRERKWSD